MTWQQKVYEEHGRQCLRRRHLPFGCEARDELPLIELEGRRMRWVGFVFVDEGSAQGDELLITEGE